MVTRSFLHYWTRIQRRIHPKAPLDETFKCENSISYQAKGVQGLAKWLNRIVDQNIKQDSFNIKEGWVAQKILLKAPISIWDFPKSKILVHRN